MTNVLPIREGNLLWNGVIFAKDLLYDMTNTELFRPIKEQSLTNGPFPSSPVPLFQSESKCKTILIKNDFDLHENGTACRTQFHKVLHLDSF